MVLETPMAQWRLQTPKRVASHRPCGLSNRGSACRVVRVAAWGGSPRWHFNSWVRVCRISQLLKLEKCGGIAQERPIGVVMLRLTELRAGQVH